jgi:hypothetical protein
MLGWGKQLRSMTANLSDMSGTGTLNLVLQRSHCLLLRLLLLFGACLQRLQQEDACRLPDTCALAAAHAAGRSSGEHITSRERGVCWLPQDIVEMAGRQ